MTLTMVLSWLAGSLAVGHSPGLQRATWLPAGTDPNGMFRTHAGVDTDAANGTRGSGTLDRGPETGRFADDERTKRVWLKLKIADTEPDDESEEKRRWAHWFSQGEDQPFTSLCHSEGGHWQLPSVSAMVASEGLPPLFGTVYDVFFLEMGNIPIERNRCKAGKVSVKDAKEADDDDQHKHLQKDMRHRKFT